MGLGLFAVSSPFVLVFALGGEVMLASLVVLACAGYLAAPVLNARGGHETAKVLPCVSGTLICYLTASVLGPEVHFHVAMFTFTGWAFNLFDARRQPAILAVLSAAPGLLYTLIEFGIRLPVTRVVLPPALAFAVGASASAISVGILIWVLWVFYRANQINEDGLGKAVQRLKEEAAVRKDALSAARAAKESAERALAVKRDFLAVMSHELRTPLNGVIGALDLLEDRKLSREQRELVDVARDSSTFLLSLLSNVLDFAAMDAGVIQLASRDFPLSQLLQDVARTCQVQVGERDLEVRHEISARVPSHATGDETRLRQVLSNLLSNAIKYTESGHVVLRADAIRGQQSSLELHVAVEDTGIGITPDQRKHIFERFVQLDAGLDRRHDGVGLGLSLCRAIISAMGGEIAVHERPGGGSIFAFVVPLRAVAEDGQAPAEGRAGSDPADTTDAPESGRVLVVEDSLVNQRIIRAMLKKLGFTDIVVRENGKLGVEAFALGSFGLVLMDIQMPVMDGITATARIRDLEREVGAGHRTKVVAVSANALPEHQLSAAERGFDLYLTKPVQLKTLRRELGKLGCLPAPPGTPSDQQPAHDRNDNARGTSS